MNKTRVVLPRTLLAAFLRAAVSAYAADSININTASAEAIARAMTGVGLKRARAIVTYRSENGPFKSVNDLSKVRGIGEATVAQSRARLKIGTQ